MRDDLVVLIDSGIDMGNLLLMNHVEGGICLAYESDEIKESKNYNDYNGHGTNCADIILQMNPTVKFYVIKIVNEHGVSSSRLMVAALNKCVQIEARIICMSLSIITEKCAIEKQLHEVCKELDKQGKIVLVSENNEMIYSQPAKFKEVIGVRASYSMKKNSWQVKESDDIQVIADGTPVFVFGKNETYNFFKGSSKANAFFAGILYKYLNKSPKKGKMELLQNIKRDSEKIERDFSIEQYGIGDIPQTEEEIWLEKVIIESIEKISRKNLNVEQYRQFPIMSNVTGISFFNFYYVLLEIYCRLNLKQIDWREVEIYNVCTLYCLRNFLKEKIKDEK